MNRYRYNLLKPSHIVARTIVGDSADRPGSGHRHDDLYQSRADLFLNRLFGSACRIRFRRLA